MYRAPLLYEQFKKRACNPASYSPTIKYLGAFDQLSQSLGLPEARGLTYGLIFFEPVLSLRPSRALPLQYGPNQQNQPRNINDISHDNLMLEAKRIAPRLAKLPYVKIISWILEDNTILAHIERRDDTARMKLLRTLALANLSGRPELSDFSFTYIDPSEKILSVARHGSITSCSLINPPKSTRSQ